MMTLAKPTKSTEQRTIQRFGYFRLSNDLNDLVVQQRKDTENGEKKTASPLAFTAFLPTLLAHPFPQSPPN